MSFVYKALFYLVSLWFFFYVAAPMFLGKIDKATKNLTNISVKRAADRVAKEKLEREKRQKN